MPAEGRPLKAYTLRDYGKAMGMNKREIETYRKQCAWNDKMAKILKTERKQEAQPNG
jgi:hypothetical protein